MPTHQIKTTITHEALAKFIQGLRNHQYAEIPTTASSLIRLAVNTASYYLTGGSPTPPSSADYRALSHILSPPQTGKSLQDSYNHLRTITQGQPSAQPAQSPIEQATNLDLPTTCLDHITDPDTRRKAANQLVHWQSGAIDPVLSLTSSNDEVRKVAKALCAALTAEGIDTSGWTTRAEGQKEES